MKIIPCLLVLLAGFCSLNAEIINTQDIQNIRKEITSDTLVLFNIAEVLMDTETTLGTQAWRKFLRARADPETHDELTFEVFYRIPHKCPDSSTPSLIQELQADGYTTFA